MAILPASPEPRGGRVHLREGHYELERAVVARDVDSIAYRTVVEYDGKSRASREIWRRFMVHEPQGMSA